MIDACRAISNSSGSNSSALGVVCARGFFVSFCARFLFPCVRLAAVMTVPVIPRSFRSLLQIAPRRFAELRREGKDLGVDVDEVDFRLDRAASPAGVLDRFLQLAQRLEARVNLPGLVPESELQQLHFPRLFAGPLQVALDLDALDGPQRRFRDLVGRLQLWIGA